MGKLLQTPNRPSWPLITVPQHCHTHHNQTIAGNLIVLIHSIINSHMVMVMCSSIGVYVQPAAQGSHVSS